MSGIKQKSRRALTATALGVVAGASAAGFALAGQSAGETSPETTTAPTIQKVPPRIAAAFPVLDKALDASEAQQLPTVALVMSVLSRTDQPSTGGANSALARRISEVGEGAEYLVPGDEVVCMVSIVASQATGGGCAQASTVETVGTTSLTVVPGGYQVTGILPKGTGEVSITDASGHRTVVAANANRAFHLLSAEPLASLAYELPGGGQHVGSLALPPPPSAPLSAP